MNGHLRSIFIGIMLCTSCSKGSSGTSIVVPSIPTPTKTSAPIVSSQPEAISGIDISGCWQIENGTSQISFSQIGTNLYQPSFGDDTAWLVSGHSFNEISNPFKQPPTYPKDQKHAVGVISEDGKSMTRKLIASPDSQTFIRCP